MELKKIQIRNFRSIKSEDIVFSHNCLILLGKNEAGKSNLLKAVASVFGKYEVSNKDRRKRVDNEKINADEYYVRAIFDLNQKDFDEIDTKPNKTLDINFDNKTVTLRLMSDENYNKRAVVMYSSSDFYNQLAKFQQESIKNDL